MQRFRWILCLILPAVFAFLLLPGRPSQAEESVPDGWTGIYTREDLESISLNPQGNYILMNDLDLAQEALTPLCSEDVPFTGSFDGNGHTVYGLNLSTQEGACGLFSYLYGGTVSSLTLSGAASGPIAGLLVGKMDGGAVRNCSVRGTVSSSACAGGLVGQICGSDTQISQCRSECTVSGTGAEASDLLLGGLCGAVYGSGHSFLGCDFFGTLAPSGPFVAAGGIVGSGEGGLSVSDCGNEGSLSLTCSDTATVGGIVGRVGWAETWLERCLFRADWTVSSQGVLYLGGICGAISAEETVSVAQCASFGSLSATGDGVYLGGIAGASVACGGTVTLSRCASYATISASAGPVYLGGIAGLNRGDSGAAVIEDCYADGSIYNADPINNDDTSHAFGGVCGANLGDAIALIRRCFSVCDVTVLYPLADGAVVGISYATSETATVSVEQCYCRAGVKEHFATAVRGAALSDPASYPGLDFSSVWTVDPGSGFPALSNGDQDPSPPLPGDTDGNGRLTEYDARLLVQYLTGQTTLSSAQMSRADADGDGALTAADGALILRNAP